MRPTLLLLRLFIAWLVLAVVACIWENLVLLWQIGGGALLFAMLVDAFTLPRRGRITGKRSLPGRFALGVESPVTLTVTHAASRTLNLELFDGIPTAAEAVDLPCRVTIPPGEYAALSYQARFLRRGQHVFTPAHVLATSAFGLWKNRHFVAGESETRAYPNYEPVVRFAMLAMANRVEQMGIVKRRRMGASLDFHQLRDYQDGDVLSRIDWKATSRRSTLVSRDYEETRNQTILLVPDCGRRMRALDGGLSQFDHCLNAMLLIAFIALRQGDEVGVVGFGGVQRWLPPVKGAHSMPKLLNHLYNYEASNEPSDFIEAAERVMTLQRRRALVILLTNLRSEDGATLASAVAAMQRRHLVLTATLREQELEQRAAASIDHLQDALQYGALTHYFGERRQLMESLRARRVLTVDESAQMLPVALANKYLDVKAGGLL
ncbi:DUF58 domain-containing protein [Prosthecobacter sp.]|uniref:DUF58 domain-containing protein n=1 Tax=Prosthecobacter sp. TaxID=1965333 RepID=UPI0037834D25